MLQEQKQGRVRLLARNGGRERREAARKSPMLRFHSASESSSFRELRQTMKSCSHSPTPWRLLGYDPERWVQPRTLVCVHMCVCVCE